MDRGSGARRGPGVPRVLVLGEAGPGIEAALSGAGWEVLKIDEPATLLEGSGPQGAAAALVDWTRESLRGAPRALRADARWDGVPILLLLDGEAPEIDWDDAPADDFADRARPREALARLRLARARARRAGARNPVTLLPGADAVRAHAERLMAEGRPFAYGAADLSDFRAFNDRYGFSAGDDALRRFAEMLRGAVERLGGPEAMAAHLGADDFAIVCGPDRAEEIGEELVAFFEQAAPTFYAPEDYAARFITVRNRAGEELIHPIMKLSAAFAVDRGGDFRHFAELVREAGALSVRLKEESRSRWAVQRRPAPRWSAAEDVPEFEAA